MIQRIQTLYLTLAVVLLLLMFAFPIANFYSEFGVWQFNMLGVRSQVPGEGAVFSNQIIFTILPILTIIISAILLLTIFNYKKRMLQIRLINLSVFLTLVMLCGIFFLYVPLIEKQTSTTVDYLSSPSIFFPIIAVIFMLLASRSIKKDEKLVRSTDRLR
ncbi:MAG: DUF4293 domain-containing protein [Bacteroidales bacterium]|jgi:hypothetical protein